MSPCRADGPTGMGLRKRRPGTPPGSPVQDMGRFSPRVARGLEGARASEAEIAEFFEEVVYRPERIEQLDDGRWLCLVTLSGRGT